MITTKKQYLILRTLADSKTPLTPDAIAKKTGIESSTTHRIFNANKNNLVNMRLIKEMENRIWRNTTEARWYILSIEGILTYLDCGNNDFFEYPTYDQLKISMCNFAEFYKYPIFKNWSGIHDSVESRDRLYLDLRSSAMFTLRQYRGSPDDTLMSEFQMFFLEWTEKNEIIKQSLKETIKDYKEILNKKIQELEKIKATV